jgi:hypothetical protein
MAACACNPCKPHARTIAARLCLTIPCMLVPHRHQMRQEMLECACPTDTSKWEECDCSSAGNPMAQVMEIWPIFMISIGIFGLVFCLIVAILAILATRQPSAVCCYSACSGFLVLIFLAVGVVFFMIGLSAAAPSSLTTRADPSLTWVGNEEECPSGLATWMGAGTDDQAMMCLVDALCQALTVTLARLTLLGFGIGVPYLVAGGAMLLACYACCCCKFDEPGAPATAAAPGNEGDFPAAQLKPPPHGDAAPAPPAAEPAPSEAPAPLDPTANKQDTAGPPLLPGIYPEPY